MEKRKLCILLAVCIFVSAACAVRKENTDKIRDVDFTVLAQEDAPQELQKEISEKKEHIFKITYADEGYLYIARGYGSRDTSGYSVEVKECYESEDAICIQTGLIGPPKDEEVVRGRTYPLVIVKVEYTQKDVVFQ